MLFEFSIEIIYAVAYIYCLNLYDWPESELLKKGQQKIVSIFYSFEK